MKATFAPCPRHWGAYPVVDRYGPATKAAAETVRASAADGAKAVVASQGGDKVASCPLALADFIVAERGPSAEPIPQDPL